MISLLYSVALAAVVMYVDSHYYYGVYQIVALTAFLYVALRTSK